MKSIYNYLINRYGNKDYQPNLYMMIDELSQRIEILEDKYDSALQDIRRLENSLDDRIDILAEHCRINENV